MKNSAFIKIIIVAACLPLFAGCRSKPPVVVAPQVASSESMFIGQPTQPPPKDQKDIVPPPPGPAPQWWFIAGHWEWRGQWAWVPGHWRTRPHPGDVWLAGKWMEETNTTLQTNIWVWQSGRWRSGAHDDRESSDR